jgi:hypothetical protein
LFWSWLSLAIAWRTGTWLLCSKRMSVIDSMWTRRKKKSREAPVEYLRDAALFQMIDERIVLPIHNHIKRFTHFLTLRLKSRYLVRSSRQMATVRNGAKLDHTTFAWFKLLISRFRLWWFRWSVWFENFLWLSYFTGSCQVCWI